MCVGACMCVRACMYVCVCVCMHVCACVHVCECVHAYVCMQACVENVAKGLWTHFSIKCRIACVRSFVQNVPWNSTLK